MQFEYTPPQTPLEEALGGHRCINAFGTIASGDDERFVDFLSRTEIPPRTDVYINSTGGDVEAAISIGRLVREHWFATHVGQYILDYASDDLDELASHLKPRKYVHGQCVSAATLVFLGGRLRHLSENSNFGVHQFSFKNPSPAHVGRSQILSAKIARYVSDMGIASEFLEISSSTASTAINLVTHEKLKELKVLTGGQTDVEWTVQARNNTLYVRGERDSLYGHHKMILGFTKGAGFYLHAVIESQGREDELTSAPLVELVVGDEESVTDLSNRSHRSVNGIYTNILCFITNDEAQTIASSSGFGLRVRFSPDAPMFLGIAPMSTDGASDMLTSFVHSLHKAPVPRT